MTDANFAILIDFAAGGLMLAAVLVVWRRDLRAIVRLLAWQGVALAAIPLLRGIHDGETALIYVGIAILALRAAALPWLLARALAAEQRDQREATPLVNTASSLLITAALTVVAFAITRPLVDLEPSATTNAVPAAFRFSCKPVADEKPGTTSGWEDSEGESSENAHGENATTEQRLEKLEHLLQEMSERLKSMEKRLPPPK